jgi:dTDP-4-dehydrorhamnose reductase
LSPRPRILIIGGDGQVSTSLLQRLQASSSDVMQARRPAVDLLEPQTLIDVVSRFRPTIVVNAAAYTAVDKAEDEPDLAKAVNAAGAETVAKAAATAGAAIVHFSTDYVFDGRKETPCLETDPVAPIGVYGRTKLLGEQLVAAANPRHVILRTAWVFSPFGSNFVRTILRLLSERDELRIVNDQYGNPTYAPDLAIAFEAIAQKLADTPEPDCFGIFHAVNAGSTTWFDFARAINEAAARRGAPAKIVRPITTADYPTKARRPAYSVLSTDKLQRVYGIKLRRWQEALDDCVDRLFALHSAAAEG